jgi:hypothetical protein
MHAAIKSLHIPLPVAMASFATGIYWSFMRKHFTNLVELLSFGQFHFQLYQFQLYQFQFDSNIYIWFSLIYVHI